jgi:undecaprenyl-diphosphatase
MSRAERTQPAVGERHAGPPPWLYVLAFLGLVFGGYAFGEMAEAARDTTPDGIDAALPAWIRSHAPQWPGVTRFFKTVTVVGNFAVGDALIALITLALVFLHRERLAGIRRADAFLWVGVTMAGRLMNILLKLYFNRARPPNEYWLIEETGLSFPSGHAVFAGVFFGMLALLIARPAVGKPLWLRIFGTLACVMMALIIAASRVWVGVHYPTDVIGGLLVGWGWVLAAWLVRSSHARWRFHRGARQGLLPTHTGNSGA